MKDFINNLNFREIFDLFDVCFIISCFFIFFVLLLNFLAKQENSINDDIPLVAESSLFGLKKKKIN